MICSNKVGFLFVIAVLALPTLFLNGYTFFHRLLLSAIELFAFIVICINAPKLKFRGTSILFVVLLFYFIFNVFFNALTGKWQYGQISVPLIESLWWLLVFLLVYVLAQLNVLQINMLDSKLVVIVLTTISLVVVFQIFFVDKLTFYTSNFAYIPLFFVPFVYLFKNVKLKVFLFFLIMIAVVLSMKRTAIVAFLCSFLAIGLSTFRNDKKNMLVVALYLGLLVLTFYHLNNYLENNLLYRFSNAVEDGGSGRTDIYSAVLNRFSELDFDAQLFGRGHNMVRGDEIYEIKNDNGRAFLSAHNDFIEVLYDYGYVGVILYFALLVKIAQSCFFWRNRNDFYYRAMLSSFIITICVSLFSHLVIYPTYIANLSLLWAMMENEKNKLELAYG